MAKQLERQPSAAPGHRVKESLQAGSRHVVSTAISGASTTPILLFELPAKKCLIKSIDVNVTTAFDASGTSPAATLTIAIPNSTGTLVVLDTSTSGLQTAPFVFSSSGKGVTTSTGGVINGTFTAATSGSAGAAEVYVEYWVIE